MKIEVEESVVCAALAAIVAMVITLVSGKSCESQHQIERAKVIMGAPGLPLLPKGITG